MKVGEKKSFEVSPEEGYGLEDPEAIQEVSKDKLPPDTKPEPGMTLYARDKNGRPMPVKIMEVKKDVVVMNFNHPLAGKTLKFEVEIIEILRVQKPVSEEQKANIKK
jgi:FKBP-type peptidyl-prolyl cis-trans isomerase 2